MGAKWNLMMVKRHAAERVKLKERAGYMAKAARYRALAAHLEISSFPDESGLLAMRASMYREEADMYEVLAAVEGS